MKKVIIMFISILFMVSNVMAIENTNNNSVLQQKKAELETQRKQIEQQKIKIEQEKIQVEKQLKADIEAKRIEAEKIKAELEIKKNQVEATKAKYTTKKEEYLAFKDALNTKKAELKLNKDENIKILNSNKQLRESIKIEIARIKNSSIIIDQSIIDTINNKNSEVKDIISNIANTNGKITSLLNQNKDLIKTKDYTQMDIVYSQINEIQKLRNNNLIYANSILTDVLNILKDII